MCKLNEWILLYSQRIHLTETRKKWLRLSMINRCRMIWSSKIDAVFFFIMLKISVMNENSNKNVLIYQFIRMDLNLRIQLAHWIWLLFRFIGWILFKVFVDFRYFFSLFWLRKNPYSISLLFYTSICVKSDLFPTKFHKTTVIEIKMKITTDQKSESFFYRFGWLVHSAGDGCAAIVDAFLFLFVFFFVVVICRHSFCRL